MWAGTKFFTITFTWLVQLYFHLQGDLCCVAKQNTEQTFLLTVAGQGFRSSHLLNPLLSSFISSGIPLSTGPEPFCPSLSSINHHTIPLITQFCLSGWCCRLPNGPPFFLEPGVNSPRPVCRSPCPTRVTMVLCWAMFLRHSDGLLVGTFGWMVCCWDFSGVQWGSYRFTPCTWLAGFWSHVVG